MTHNALAHNMLRLSQDEGALAPPPFGLRAPGRAGPSPFRSERGPAMRSSGTTIPDHERAPPR